MKKIWFLLLVTVTLVSSCSYGNYMLHFSGSQVDDRATAIATVSGSDLPIISDTVYSFLIIADAHFGASKTNKHLDRFREKFTALFDAEDSEKPRFIINLGDNMDDGKQDEADDCLKLENQLKEIAKEKLSLASADDFKIYTILGNHDLYAEDGWDVWKKSFFPGTKYGTSYYRFTLGAFSYYFLDTANGTLGKAQLDDLEERLSADSHPKIILMHYPIAPTALAFSLQNTLERNRLLYDFARTNVRKIFSGHYHPGNEKDYGDFGEYTVMSFGYKETSLLVTVNENTQTISYRKIDF